MIAREEHETAGEVLEVRKKQKARKEIEVRKKQETKKEGGDGQKGA